MTEIPSGAHFVFVHGAFHGAWCWYKIRCLLESVGHKVTCVDLLCGGIDPTDPNTISSFKEYNKPLDDVLTGLAGGEKVILVGHSASGSNVTAALYSFPEKIRVAVYLVALMKKYEYMNQDTHMMFCGGGYSDEIEMYEYVYGEGPDHPPTSLMIKKQYQRQRFYQRSPLQDSTLAGMLLKPVPIRALEGQPYGEKDVSKVPRVYIKTLDDNALSQEAQDEMIAKWQPSDVYSIDSDHSAFFSAPIELFGILHNVATTYSLQDGCSSQGTGASNQKASYGNCMKYSSFFDQEDVNANGRVIRGRQKMQKFGNEGEQVVVTMEKVAKENNEKAYGNKETREAFSRIYNGLKILMLLSVWILIALLFILATRA